MQFVLKSDKAPGMDQYVARNILTAESELPCPQYPKTLCFIRGTLYIRSCESVGFYPSVLCKGARPALVDFEAPREDPRRKLPREARVPLIK